VTVKMISYCQLLFYILKYIIFFFVIFVQSLHETDDEASIERTIYETYYPELVATFTGNLLADIMLYPLETILYRLYLQVLLTTISYIASLRV